MEDAREPAGEPGAGGGSSKRGAITDKTQAAHMEGFFLKLPPDTKAPSAPPPPGPKAATQTQPTFRNGPRDAYDGTTPGASANGTRNRNTSSRQRLTGVLAMPRGQVTGARANAPTSGAHIWASLLSQSAGQSPSAKRASRAWGRMNEDEMLATLFHDPAAQAADTPPRLDAAAIEL